MSSDDFERPSGRDPVLGALDAADEATAGFQPVAGRGFNVTISGVFVGTVALMRRFADDETDTLHPCTDNGIAISWTAPASEVILEPEHGVEYVVKMTARTSGAANVRISQ